MALSYHPKEGEVLKCDFSGFIEPEMVKARWVVAISPKYIERGRLVTIVPLSTTPPTTVQTHHFKLVTPLPHNEGDEIDVWAKCDMVFAASFNRLSPWLREKKAFGGKRTYISVVIPKDELLEIKKCVLWSLGLGGLAKQMKEEEAEAEEPAVVKLALTKEA